jgi:hypothetical protein
VCSPPYLSSCPILSFSVSIRGLGTTLAVRQRSSGGLQRFSPSGFLYKKMLSLWPLARGQHFSLAGTTNIRFLIFSSVLLTSLSKERLDRSLPLRGLRSRWHARSFPKQRSLLMDSFRLTQCDIYFLKVPPAFPIHGTRMQTKDKRLWSSISICIQISSFLTDHTFFLSDAPLFTSKFVSLVLTICVKRGSQCYSPMSDWSSWCSSSDG